MSMLRRALAAVRGYSAAKQPTGRAPWFPPRGGPNNVLAGAAQTVAARARDAVRNNAYAARIVELWTSNAVGTGITTSWSSPGHARAWALWSKSLDADAEGVHDWAGIQSLATRAMVESGESLIWMRDAPSTASNPVGLRLHVMEADRLDWSFTGMHEGNRVVQGIEVDASGRRVAYHIRPELDEWPTMRIDIARVRVPASEMIHLFRRRRPGQMRDVSWLAPILWQLKDLTEYEAALLRKAYVEACLALVVLGEDDSAVTGETADLLTDSQGRTVEELEPNMILYRRGPGGVETINPSGGGSHAGFAKRTLEAAAVGAGLTYDQVSGDLTGATYSSLRAGKIEFRTLLQQVQYSILIPMLCGRVAQRFHERGVAVGLLSDPTPEVRHVPPAPEMIDPGRDTAALVAQVRAGFVSPQEAAGMLGSDFYAILAEITDANAAADEAGVILDSDPRRTARGGGAQDATQNAAIEIAATGAASG